MAQGGGGTGASIGSERADASFAELLIDESPDALLALSAEGTVLSWNRGAELLFGYGCADVVGRPLDELIVPPDRQQQARDALGRALTMGTALFGTVRRRKDGATVDVDVSMRTVRDAAGNVRFVAVNERDVSEMHRLRELCASESRFRELLDAAPDAMVIASDDGRIVLANVQTERLFGYPRYELIGRHVEMLLPERFGRKHPAFRAEYFRDPRPRAMGAGIDLHARRKDGTEFAAEISLSPLTSDHGVFVTAAIRDVTARRKVEATFRAFLEAAPDAIVIVDADGIIVRVSSQTERLFGHPREALLGRPVEVLVPERLRARHPEHRTAFFADPKARAMGTGLDLQGLRRDGSEFPVEVSLSPLETPDGTFVTAAIRDVTERKHLEAILAEQTRGLQEANRLKNQLLANVSHELRTPLDAIIGFSGLIHGGDAGPISPEQKAYLGDILSSSQHLLELLNDILNVANNPGA